MSTEKRVTTDLTGEETNRQKQITGLMGVITKWNIIRRDLRNALRLEGAPCAMCKVMDEDDAKRMTYSEAGSLCLYRPMCEKCPLFEAKVCGKSDTLHREFVETSSKLFHLVTRIISGTHTARRKLTTEEHAEKRKQERPTEWY